MDKIWRKGYGLGSQATAPLLVARSAAYRNQTRENWHSHTAAQLMFCTQGVVRVLTPQASWTLGPLRAIWLPSDLPHEFHALGDIRTYSLYIDPQTAMELWPQCRGLQVSVLMNELVQAMLKAQDPVAPDPLRAELIAPLLLDELRHAKTSAVCSVPLPTDRRLLNICELMLAAPDNNDTLDFWGAKVGASSRTVARLFREQTGMTFAGWRQQLRLAEAVAQLAQGKTVVSIASQLGYHSPSAFISMFKKTLGETPQRYLRA
ncbi:AraC family transcriptional regulator [Rahnella sp. AA]|uniref:AraC family transcriptional regulator n=1 Tax=Rahnella sp. AA TaxID=2057180 RepID=UPI000C3335EF|nr:helix-turn-helix transcriptional regulator [Rahnella sp. AA]PKE31443.1 AraC family transcriptional regulator [Rahnella sp. AA]